MTWVRFDDQYPIHRKYAPLTDRRYRLANEALFWSSRNRTDGRILPDELTQIRTNATKADAADLVSRRIWHGPRYDCPNATCPPPVTEGWVIHDYWDYQPSKAAAAAEQEKRAKAGRLGGVRSGQTRRSKGEANAKQVLEAGASRLLEPRPVPSPLLPEEGGTGAPRRADALGAGADAPVNGNHPPSSNGSHSDDWGEDPRAVADHQAEMHHQAEAAVVAIADQQDRTHRGAAAARAALRPAKTPTRRAANNALDELRALTDGPAPPTDQPLPCNECHTVHDLDPTEYRRETADSPRIIVAPCAACRTKTEPTPNDEVWIAAARRDIEAHRPIPGGGSTACRRATRTGEALLAAQATERHDARWCPRCWPWPTTEPETPDA